MSRSKVYLSTNVGTFASALGWLRSEGLKIVETTSEMKVTPFTHSDGTGGNLRTVTIFRTVTFKDEELLIVFKLKFPEAVARSKRDAECTYDKVEYVY